MNSTSFCSLCWSSEWSKPHAWVSWETAGACRAHSTSMTPPKLDAFLHLTARVTALASFFTWWNSSEAERRSLTNHRTTPRNHRWWEETVGARSGTSQFWFSSSEKVSDDSSRCSETCKAALRSSTLMKSSPRTSSLGEEEAEGSGGSAGEGSQEASAEAGRSEERRV